MNRFQPPSADFGDSRTVPMIQPDKSDVSDTEQEDLYNNNNLDNLIRLTQLLAQNQHRRPATDSQKNGLGTHPQKPTTASAATTAAGVPSVGQDEGERTPSSSSSVASSYTTSSDEYTLVNEEEDGEEDGDDDEDDSNESLTSGAFSSDFNDKDKISFSVITNPRNEKSDTDANTKNRDTNLLDDTGHTPNRGQEPKGALGEGSQRSSGAETPQSDFCMDLSGSEPLFISNPTAYLDFTSSPPSSSSSSSSSLSSKYNDSDESNSCNNPSENNEIMLDDLVVTERDSDVPNDLSRSLIPSAANNTGKTMNAVQPPKSGPLGNTTVLNLNFPETETGNKTSIRRPLLLRERSIELEDSENTPLVSGNSDINSPASAVSTTSSSPSLNLLQPTNTVDSQPQRKSASSSVSENESAFQREVSISSGILRKIPSTSYPSSSRINNPETISAKDDSNAMIAPKGFQLVLKKNNLALDIGRKDRGSDVEGLEFGRAPMWGGDGYNRLAALRANQRADSRPGTPTVVFSIGPQSNSQQTLNTPEPSIGVPMPENDKTPNNGRKNTPIFFPERRANVLRESLFLILSSLYGILVVLIGAVIPITDVFVSERVHSNFEVFYVYLYTVSILFLVYVYAYLLRRNRDLMNRSAVFVRQLTRAWSSRRLAPRKGDGLTTRQDSKPKTTRRTISLDMTNHHTGTFYLRLGVLGFGMGSMIHCGLQFGSHFSLSEECSKKLQMVKPLLHMVFAFAQLYFIFMNSKMCIHRYKKLARFGLMHMCATNICVWFRSIVVETVHVIRSHNNHDHRTYTIHYGHDTPHRHSGLVHKREDHNASHHGSHSHQDTNDSSGHHSAALAENHTSNCYWSEIMHKAADSAGPYLYPCTIEYSLMCACILYIMWKNVGQRPIRREASLDVGGDADGEDKRRVHRMSVDCTSSSRGLFLGILTIVGSIISIIAFYMLVREPDLKHTAYVLTHVSETAVYLLTLIALILASYKMRTFNFKVQQEAELEDILIVISYTGLVAFIVFSLMASIIHQASTSSILNIVSNIAMLIQATLQTIFMLAGDRMSASSYEQVKKKPGREFVTFMLISNFAMWAINTFETQTPEHNPIQVDVYGIEAWAIFTHISVPLGIYYRFHSTVCMSNIWKNAWKLKKIPL